MLTLWKRLPEQLKRLLLLLIILITAFVLIRSVLVPDDFGQYGHFRASALGEIMSQNVQYAGQKACSDCHSDMVELKDTGYHKTVACEVCHGPAAAHIDDVETVKLAAPRERDYCPLCHEYLPSRPTGFPQIVTASHNPMKACITCHNPHSPKPQETPKECSACHAEIARAKSLSRHVYVPCTRCHQTPDEHKIRPREIRPEIPQTREFCGSCHALTSSVEKGIPKIDLATHEERYLCWQCHYPHLPEVH